MPISQVADPGAPPFRPLKVYAFDPSRGRTLGNVMTLNVPYESKTDLSPGPIGKYLEIIDYDGNNKCYYKAVDLNDPEVLIRGGLDPSDSDPRFHQQMVYAVASETIQRFEFSLGRRIHWRNGRRRLRIFPHAMQEANAYYDKNLGALLFGYFPAAAEEAGSNLPGQTVFTCLSHDIVVHETTHALIDGLREYFTEATNPDTPAFHEGFADIVALFQHFSQKEALLDTIQRTGGRMYAPTVAPDTEPGTDGPLIQAELTRDNPMVQLAQQFGEAMGLRGALRSAIGSRPNARDLEKAFEPHARGAILVAAVFDAFFSIYVRRTRDLMRIARAGGMLARPGDLHPDLANRLAAEAAKTAGHFQNICIRALDYCPPVDITYGDFLRAMITADHDLVPDDDKGYRGAIIEAFRLRGVRPDAVTSYAEESLVWDGPDESAGAKRPSCPGLQPASLDTSTHAEYRMQQEENAKRLHAFAVANRGALGLSNEVETIEVTGFHALHRVGPDGQLRRDFVAQFVQTKELPLRLSWGLPADGAQNMDTFRGGTTVVLDARGELRYALHRRIDSASRREAHRSFVQRLGMESPVTAFSSNYLPAPLDFAAVHRGY